MRRNLMLGVLSMVLALAGSTKCLAGPFIVDSFNVPNTAFFQANNFPAGPASIPFNGAFPTSDVVGGFRNGNFAVLGSPAINNTFSVAVGGGALGNLTVATALANTATSALTLQYNANGVGLNANASGQTGFQVSVDILDAAAVGTVLKLTVKDGEGDTYSMSQTVVAPGSQVWFFPFADLTPVGIQGPLNISQIQDITFVATIPSSGDIALDNFSTYAIPEPSSILVFGSIAAISGGFWIRKRRAAKVA